MKSFENVMKNVEVMMVKKEEVDGKMVKVIKMMDMNENVMDYIEVGSSDKVKEMIKDKIRISRVFGGFDVDELWYKWDGFLREWRKRRMKWMKDKKDDEEVKEVEEVFVDFDVKEDMDDEMKSEFLKMWRKKKMELKKKKKEDVNNVA